MKVFHATVGHDGRIAIPTEIRRCLGVTVGDSIAFHLMEDGTVEVLRKRPGLEDVVGSIQALPNESPDLEAEIEKATEENADRFMRRLEGR